MKNGIMRTLFGVCLLGAAVMLAGELAGWWTASFDGAWTVFLIVPGIAGIISGGMTFWNVGLVIFGLWLFANARGWLVFVPKEVYYIAILVFLGLWLILRPIIKSKGMGKYFPPSVETVIGNGDSQTTSAVFSASRVKCSSFLSGGKFNAVFGAMEVDLRDTVIKHGTVISVNAVFGAVKFYTSGNCRVVFQGIPIFGGADDNSIGKGNENLPVLYVKYKAVFGGIAVN